MNLVFYTVLSPDSHLLIISMSPSPSPPTHHILSPPYPPAPHRLLLTRLPELYRAVSPTGAVLERARRSVVTGRVTSNK